jgi:hypothetical protein
MLALKLLLLQPLGWAPPSGAMTRRVARMACSPLPDQPRGPPPYHHVAGLFARTRSRVCVLGRPSWPFFFATFPSILGGSLRRYHHRFCMREPAWRRPGRSYSCMSCRCVRNPKKTMAERTVRGRKGDKWRGGDVIALLMPYSCTAFWASSYNRMRSSASTGVHCYVLTLWSNDTGNRQGSHASL